jgi:hypothetical protein
VASLERPVVPIPGRNNPKIAALFSAIVL